MARPNLIRQIYGYLVCLIAIVTLLVAASSLIGAIFDLNRPPTMDRYGPGQTFEEYRMERLNAEKVRQANANTPATTDATTVPVPPDSVLRRDYNESRALQAAAIRWEATKSIVTSILMIIIALALFTIHWRWLRGLERLED